MNLLEVFELRVVGGDGAMGTLLLIAMFFFRPIPSRFAWSVDRKSRHERS